MDNLFLLQVFLYVGGLIVLILLSILIIEAIRTLKTIQKIAHRIELLSDLKGWLSFFKKWPKKQAS